MSMNTATELASAIQSVHIRQNPDVEHDLAPETSVDRPIPIDIIPQHHTISSSPVTSPSSSQRSSILSAPSTIPSDIIRARPRRRTLPPFPDFRFEQSYLASVKDATSNWQVLYITVRDQVVWPLISGAAYNLIMFGWKHWNRDTKLRGQGFGARLRRWWWEVNNWKVPVKAAAKEEFARSAQDVSYSISSRSAFDFVS